MHAISRDHILNLHRAPQVWHMMVLLLQYKSSFKITMSREMHEEGAGETVSSRESRDVLELAATNTGWQAKRGELPEFEFWNRQTRFWIS